MKKINQLFSECNGSVYIVYRDNNSNDESNSDWLEDEISDSDLCKIAKEIIDEMIKRGSIIEVQFYQDTPIGFYQVYHYDLESAIDSALQIIRRDRAKPD